MPEEGLADLRQAVILAGGFGTRLGALTRDTPKPLLDVAGKPFLTWLIDDVRRQGFSDILVCAGFLAEQIEAALAGFGPDVKVVTEPQPLGTAGALRFVLDRLEARFLMLNGDSLFDIDLRELERRAHPDADATLALRSVADASRYGAVQLDGRRIVRFEEKSEHRAPGLINGGVAIIGRSFVADLQPGRPCSIERDLYPKAAAAGRLAGHVFNGAFIDIGTPQDYERAQTVVPEALNRR